MSSIPRRSPRIAARNFAKLKVEVTTIADEFHALQHNPPARRMGHVTFVQNDLASYNPSSCEYLVAAQLIRTQSNVKCKACKVEFFTSILAWLIQHPQLLHQIKGFPDVVQQKIIEIQADLHCLSNDIKHRGGDADFNGIGYNDMELYGVYNKALGYIQIMQMVLDKMAA